MRDYKDVVDERYEKEAYDGKSIENNIYSVYNNIGYKGYVRIVEEIRDFIRKVARESEKSLDDIYFLDVGCGTGANTRIISEILGNPKQVAGVDYSRKRIEQFKKMNPAIECMYGDITKEGSFDARENGYDGIVIIDCIMHLRKREDVLNALKNCRRLLKRKGLLLWYDPNVKSHYENLDSDGEGFSKQEMDMHCKAVGLELLSSKTLFKYVPFYKTNTVYFKPDFSLFQTLFMEKILPTKGAINIRIYRKPMYEES